MTRQTRGGTKKVRQTQDKECGYNELKACAVLVCEGAWVSQGRCPGQSQQALWPRREWFQHVSGLGGAHWPQGLGSAWGPGVDH